MELHEHIEVWRRKRAAWNEQRRWLECRIRNQRKQLRERGEAEPLIADLRRKLATAEADLERLRRDAEQRNANLWEGLSPIVQARLMQGGIDHPWACRDEDQ